MKKVKFYGYGVGFLLGLILIGMIVGNLKDTNYSEKMPNETTQEEIESTGESEIHFIDTGNSDAILITSNGKAMLVDGGDNDDETLVVNYIKSKGITELEYVIATHPHADHVGGLDAVVSELNVKTVFVANGDSDTKTYRDFIEAAINRGLSPSVPLEDKKFLLGVSELNVKTVFVANGDSDTKTYRDFIEAAINRGLSPSVPLEDKKFLLGNAYFTVLNTNGGNDTNNQSLVVEYVNGEDKILLMGDAEKEVEEEILSKVSKVDLLKVGHHGSRSSTSQAFFDKVSPKYAVITCGVNNKYGHPHQETVSKLTEVEVHRTDECGHIVFVSTGKGIETACEEGSLTSGGKSVKPTALSDDLPNDTTSPVVEQIPSSSTQVVYWTLKGKSYHVTKECPALSRSKGIYSGTIAESGKDAPCDQCY